ncbi:hypothetical protein [Haloarcula onubensis]|uniref:DUF7982 domain-containing protein n=1 Tax=Haloarcula onubensis TaxID=2950539 RepID=A0ABU2FJ67_9EURY|nr:hypothetical protein [Halomicroarcula sp. S3CR25-11]MDS0280798.1 hypothetical protein [Halomicroarcula sp. S3CR25-11]
MSTNGRRTDDTAEEPPQRLAELRTQVELLAEENERLRESYTRAKRTEYRRTAFGLAAVGAVAAAAGLLVPTASAVLFALAGTGLFGGILTYYLTPERFIAADVGRDVYATLADNEAALVGELGLTSERVYVPLSGNEVPVRLFVPQQSDYDLPDADALTGQTVLADDPATRGVALAPSGARLLGDLETALRGSLADAPGDLAVQLCDALVEQFELVDSADPETDADGTACRVAVSDSVYGPLDRFDHPVVSLLATGFAVGLSVPVTTEVRTDTDGASVVTLRWASSTDDD